MIRESVFYGNAIVHSMSADLELHWHLPRVHHLQATAPGLVVLLPDARNIPTGGPTYYLINDGAYDVGLWDYDDNPITTISVGAVVPIYLLDNSVAAGTWFVVDGATFTRSPGAAITDPTAKEKIFSGSCAIDTTFAGEFYVGAIVPFSAYEQIGTVFSGTLSESAEKLFSGVATIGTSFAGNFGVYGTTNIVSPTATGTGDGTLGDPWTLRQAGQNLSPGDTCILRGGTYGTGAAHILDSVGTTVNSGTDGNPITFKPYPGETPILTGAFRLMGCKYLEFEDLEWQSQGASWIQFPYHADQGYCQWTRCTFKSTTGAGAYSGIDIRSGSHYQWHECTFGTWWNGDHILMRDTADVLFESCDFRNANAPHGNINTNEVTRIIIRNCVFRNMWARSIALRRRDAGEVGLIENCVIIDSDWGLHHPVQDPPSDAWESGTNEVCRVSLDKTIVRNCAIVGSNGGDVNIASGYDYAAGWTINLHDSYNEARFIRVYNNVFYANRLNNLAFVKNISAGTTYTNNNRWRNNVISHSDAYELLVYHADYDWETWEFDTNRIYNPTTSAQIYLIGASPRSYTLAEAEAAHGTVFKDNLGTAPDLANAGLLASVKADAALLDDLSLADLIEAFTATVDDDGYGAAKELTTVTADATSDTISVEDSYWIFPGSDLLDGDFVIIGSNSPVEVIARPSATSIQLASSITVTTGDKVYLDRMTTSPSVGLYALETTAEKRFAGIGSIGTAFAGQLNYSAIGFSGACTIGTAFAGQFVADNNLFEITHDSGSSGDYDAWVDGSGKLSIASAAALKSTAYGLSVQIASTTPIYGRKDFAYTERYLRWRMYIDPNSLPMGSGENFNFCELTTVTGYLTGYLTLSKVSSTFYVTCRMRNDAGDFLATSAYTITDEAHYIEVEQTRASTNSASDGWMKLWIDGVLKQTVSDIDQYDQTRATRFFAGAVRGIDAGTLGTCYIDEIVLREESTEIGA